MFTMGCLPLSTGADFFESITMWLQLQGKATGLPQLPGAEGRSPEFHDFPSGKHTKGD